MACGSWKVWKQNRLSYSINALSFLIPNLFSLFFFFFFLLRETQCVMHDAALRIAEPFRTAQLVKHAKRSESLESTSWSRFFPTATRRTAAGLAPSDVDRITRAPMIWYIFCLMDRLSILPQQPVDSHGLGAITSGTKQAHVLVGE
jgi:hypothetical protein